MNLYSFKHHLTPTQPAQLHSYADFSRALESPGYTHRDAVCIHVLTSLHWHCRLVQYWRKWSTTVRTSSACIPLQEANISHSVSCSSRQTMETEHPFKTISGTGRWDHCEWWKAQPKHILKNNLTRLQSYQKVIKCQYLSPYNGCANLYQKTCFSKLGKLQTHIKNMLDKENEKDRTWA